MRAFSVLLFVLFVALAHADFAVLTKYADTDCNTTTTTNDEFIFGNGCIEVGGIWEQWSCDSNGVSIATCDEGCSTCSTPAVLPLNTCFGGAEYSCQPTISIPKTTAVSIFFSSGNCTSNPYLYNVMGGCQSVDATMSVEMVCKDGAVSEAVYTTADCSGEADTVALPEGCATEGIEYVCGLELN